MKFVNCPKCLNSRIIYEPMNQCYFCIDCGCKFNPDTKEPIDVPFADTHITGPVIVIDITFTTGEISRMNFCYSFIFENGVLTLTKDMQHKHTEVIENVSRLEVIAIEH